jgi:hypothetical protein
VAPRPRIALFCLTGLALNVKLWQPFFPYFFARANNDFAGTRAVPSGNRETKPQAPGYSPQFMMHQ